MKKILFIAAFGICLIANFFPAPCPAAGKDSVSDKVWHTLETSHTIILYKSTEDLKKFNDAVDYSPAVTDVRWLYLHNANTLEEKIRNKADAIFERVQEILDMRKPMKKVSINLYNSRENLQKAFLYVTKSTTPYRAGYIFEYNTIYLNVTDLHAGMLAHEMAHAIIDHYMTVRPPSATAEILARYVDSHLMR